MTISPPALEAGTANGVCLCSMKRISASEEAGPYTTSPVTDFDIWRIHSETALLMRGGSGARLGAETRRFDADDYEN